MNVLGNGDGNSLANEPKDIVNLPVSILNWFRKAMPTPTKKNRSVQLGVHFEETAEMTRACGELHLADRLDHVANLYKNEWDTHYVPDGFDRLELLDGLCDQIVTAIGTAYGQGFDIIGALEAVNANNWSKFVNGEPQWTAQGKIAKPATYTKVDLTPFLGVDPN